MRDACVQNNAQLQLSRTFKVAIILEPHVFRTSVHCGKPSGMTGGAFSSSYLVLWRTAAAQQARCDRAQWGREMSTGTHLVDSND